MRHLVIGAGFLGFLALSGCQHEAVTVYPVIHCKKGCEVITSSGETVTRRLVAGAPARYTASTATQDVLVEQLGMVQSLPRDRKYACRVLTPRDWECTRDLAAPGSFERVAMKDGDLSSMAFPMEDTGFVTYVGRCQWNHIGWRNRTGSADPSNVLGGLLGWTAGCVLPAAKG
jgi:hypothetical protein